MYVLSDTTIDDNQIIAQNFTDTTWLQYFDPARALAAVAAHVASLPSSRTPEKYTSSVYSDSLKYFLNWCGCQLETTSEEYQAANIKQILGWSITTMPLPSADLIQLYAAHLTSRGLKANTICHKYFAPLRHYLKALTKQMIAVTGIERDFVYDCREHIRQAIDVKPPRKETTSHLSPLYQHGIRLELGQVNAVLRAIDRTTRSGLRDYALLYLAFATGLRLAEIQRLTLNNFAQDGKHILLTVRGKRNNYDPIPVSRACYDHIQAYVTAHNTGLPEDDPRRIVEDGPLWQPYLHGDNYLHPACTQSSPERGFMQDGIRAMMRRRVEAVLGQIKSRQGARFSAHDTRRTFAYLADSAGMEIKNVSAAMRHANVATTYVYIGQSPDYDDWMLESRVKLG